MSDDSNQAHPQLPRRLAIQLLHAAQEAADKPFNAVVTMLPAQNSMPDQMAIIDLTDTMPDALEIAADTPPWALYLYRPGQSSAPSPSDFDLLPRVMRLTASLATKGVLQLHAWRCVDGHVEEVPLRIAD